MSDSPAERRGSQGYELFSEELLERYGLTLEGFRRIQLAQTDSNGRLSHGASYARVVLAKTGWKETDARVYSFAAAESGGRGTTATLNPKDAKFFEVHYTQNSVGEEMPRPLAFGISDEEQVRVAEDDEVATDELETMVFEGENVLAYIEKCLADPALNRQPPLPMPPELAEGYASAAQG